MMESINVELDFDNTAYQKIKEDWPAAYGDKMKVFLQMAYQNDEFIGWHGEFADDDLVDLLEDGFMFENNSILFYGTADDLSEAIKELDSKQLFYPEEGRIFIRSR